MALFDYYAKILNELTKDIYEPTESKLELSLLRISVN